MKSLEVPITIETDGSDLGDDVTLVLRIRQAVVAAVRFQGFECGSVGVLITDDETIHGINLQHLDHDYPTDVISFAYHNQMPQIEGELVASLDTARREAGTIGWSTLNELLLYVVHGTLHICGLDDQTDDARLQMRRAEQQILLSLGILVVSGFDPEVQSVPGNGCQIDIHSRTNYS